MRISNRGNFLVGAAVGSGISARAAELGGADFLVVINAGRLRNMGAPSIACLLPTHDAASLSLGVALNEILPQSRVPVLLGVNCWEAGFDPDKAARKVQELGFAGVANFPTAMLFSFGMRRILESAGIGLEREVEMLLAVQELGLDSLYFCGTRSQAQFAARSGLNMILLNFGWNAGGKFGHGKRQSLEEMGVIARDVGRLVKRINPKCRFLLEGGSIVSSEDLGYVTEHAPIDGYVGGSTLDRLPFETAVSNKIAGYKHATEARNTLSEIEKKTVAWAEKFSLFGNSSRFLSFLVSLRHMAAANLHAAILAESGLDVEGAIRTFAAQTRKITITIDILEEAVPAHVIRKLLGYASEKGFNTGVLLDDSVGVVVIKNCHAMPLASQRRLASALTIGRVAHPRTRKMQSVAARVLFISRQPMSSNDTLEGFAPELDACLRGWTLTYPPLRERTSDISILYQSVAEQAIGPKFPPLSPAAIQVFRVYAWRGNDAELRSLVGLVAAEGIRDEISNETAKELINANTNLKISDVNNTQDEKKRIVDALWRYGFHRGNTADFLGMSRKTLYNKMVKFELSNTNGPSR